MATVNISEDQMKEFRVAFSVFDKDGDGSLSIGELSSILAARGLKLSDQEVSNLIGKYDANNDGTIDFEEFVKLMSESEIAAVAQSAQVFKALDADGNGSVSAEELKSGLQRQGVHLTPEQQQKLIAVASANGNGELSFEEFLRVLSK